MSVPPTPTGASVIPEVGPSLGRLTDPPITLATGPLGITLDDLRLELVSRVFDLAGTGRHFADAGDREGALQSLGRTAWLGAWEQTVAAAAARLADAVNAGFRGAAAESRLSAARLRDLLLTADDTRAIAARLGRGSADFVAALDALGPAAAAAGAPGDRGRAGWQAWQEALGAAARRLESAWLALEAAAAAEQARWQVEITRVRAWRRPVWPLWLITALTLLVATYFGLLLGGYLPVPSPLEGFTDFVWNHLWI